jgi:uncharacterized protein (UPF0261 family)
MTAMRTAAQENEAIAEFISAKLNPSEGQMVEMLLPGGDAQPSTDSTEFFSMRKPTLRFLIPPGENYQA